MVLELLVSSDIEQAREELSGNILKNVSVRPSLNAKDPRNAEADFDGVYLVVVKGARVEVDEYRTDVKILDVKTDFDGKPYFITELTKRVADHSNYLFIINWKRNAPIGNYQKWVSDDSPIASNHVREDIDGILFVNREGKAAIFNAEGAEKFEDIDEAVNVYMRQNNGAFNLAIMSNPIYTAYVKSAVLNNQSKYIVVNPFKFVKRPYFYDVWRKT